MSSVNFPANNQTWRQLVGNGLLYIVPRFQRDYSWTQDEWDDLWQDVKALTLPGGEPSHYMGYLVLQELNAKTFQVIDGQQRLTTLSLLSLAVLKVLDDLVKAKVDAENNGRRSQILRGTFIGFLDPQTLTSRNKLTLNRNNDGYYRDYIVPLAKLPQRKLRTSEHALRKAFEWFYLRVKEEFSGKDGASLAKFLEDLSDRLFFTVITVTDELNAFKVFETLNARGVRLSPTDLLKNYLFSVVHRDRPSGHESEIDDLERRWDRMVGKLGNESFPDFLRSHWNSRNKFVRESDLFKTIRAATADRTAVFGLLKSMEEDLDTYSAFQDPEDPIWNREQKESIRDLRMFNVRQPRPLLMAARRSFDEKGFTKILQACSVISFRYNVIGGLATGFQETTYNNVAQKVASGELKKHGQVIQALAPIYLGDDTFQSAFGEKALKTSAARNKNIVRYILFRLEKQLTGKDFDIGSADTTLEHIFPENPSGNWPEFHDDDDEWLYRIGNITLLKADDNRRTGSKGFDLKKIVFAASAFEITRSIASENSEWNSDRIATRQRGMAKLATAIWQVASLK